MSAAGGGPVPPGSAIGILGGGQLGRMAAMAAARLGYRAHVYTDREPSPAIQVSERGTVASFGDRDALARFCDGVAAATYEFENVPVEAAEFVAGRVPLRPSPRALAVAQDRLAEKEFVRRAGAATVAFAPVDGPGDLAPALAEVGTPAVLKTRREGYDGRGQARVGAPADAEAAWEAIGGAPALAEAWAPFEREISVVLARAPGGAAAAYDPAENEHEEGILALSTVPAAVPAELADEARATALRIADALGYEGVLAVEMFVLPGGGLLVNEIAPRPHNSGHWTIDAAETSQFEQQVRVCAGLPLGSVRRTADAAMRNLLGAGAGRWREFVREGRDRLHLYGKGEARPGRKMGHVTRLFPLGSGPRGFAAGDAP